MRKTFFARRWLAALLTLTLCLPLAPAALADDPATNPDQTPTISVSPRTKKLEPNQTVQLSATVTDPNVPNAVVTNWISSDGTVATVDLNGLVTAVADGTATITATYIYNTGDSVSDACTITVETPTAIPTLDHITATFPSLSVEAGKSKALPAPTKVTAHYDNGSTQDLTTGYTVGAARTDDADTATVGANNQVMGVKAGSTTLKVPVSYNGVSGEGTCAVTVTPPAASAVTDIVITRPNVTTPPLSMSSGETQQVTVVTTPENSDYTWTTSDRSVAVVENGNIRAVGPGTATLTVTADDAPDVKASIDVMVRGFKKLKDSATVNENGSVSLSDLIETFGTTYNDLTIWSNKSTVAEVVGNEIKGKSPGTATITATAKTGNFSANFTITVEPDGKNTIQAGTIKSTETLPFNTLYRDFGEQAGGKLHHIVGLSVDTRKGTLFYNYKSEDVPNIGVGDSAYYRNPSIGQRGISDITFVPKRDFAGGEVIISYTAVSEDNQNYRCRIMLNVDPGTGSTASISLTADYNTPVRFSGEEFERVCREQTGANLDYVVFSLPAEREGTLYTNYKGEGNYGSKVSASARYGKSALNDLWFVPAPGFPARNYPETVTIYYTGHSKGASASTYKGQVTITVNPENNTAIGGLAYDITKGGVAFFDDGDFNDYCQDDLMDDRQTLSFVRFDSLPAASEGVLYYDYRSSTNTGSRASTGTSYYYGTRSPRIDRLAFVPAADFIGTVKLPFSGQTTSGVRFSGNVEINVRGGTGTGDIYYTCAPGRTVGFRTRDFTDLSQKLNGRTIDYIRFRNLPNASDGYLYHNSTRVSSVGTAYYNSTGSYRIGNLSFRASNSFSGTVDIPFEGTDRNGGTFSGVITISSNNSGAGAGNIRYTANAKSAAVFDRDDFDSLSWEETREYINTVRFKIPGSSEGTLYRNYRSSSNSGTKITTSNYSVSASALDQVAFVPANGYTGTVYLDFTATALNNGGTFDGTVEIEVGRAPADVTVSYSTRSTTPVNFYGGDFGRRGYTLSSIRFTELPSASAGRLYSEYVSPTRYGRQAGTGTSYRVSGGDLISDLTFVPRAGYTGTVSIPYVGTNSNNSTFEGEVLITVSPTYSSSYFSDMGGYSEAQRAAVDFLYDHNITRGLTATQYGPEASIRRGDFARMVYQAFELSPTGSAGAFRDVPAGAYYAEAVNALYARGIVSGIGGGYYAPDSTLTRQDAVCMIQRAMRAVGWSANDGYASNLYGYSDGADVSGYAQGAVSFAIQRGYLPTGSGRINPTQALTRVDMAEIIHRVLTY